MLNRCLASGTGLLACPARVARLGRVDRPGGLSHLADTNARATKARRNQRGLTLIELIVAFTIMLILTTMAVPLARSKVRAERERDLRYALREMRYAIDKY